MIEILKKFFKKEQWEVVYSTCDIDKYLNIKHMLLDNNISIKSKITEKSSRLSSDRPMSAKSTKMYDILVKKECIEKSMKILDRVGKHI